MAESKSKVFHARFYVRWAMIEALIGDFETDDPITALQYTLDWVTVEYFTSPIEGKLKLDGFDDEENPKAWRDELYNQSCSRMELLN